MKFYLFSDIGEELKEAILPEKVDFLGLKVGPSLYTAFLVTVIVVIFCLAVRLFALPRFKKVPGKFQLFLEGLVSSFGKMAKESTHKYTRFISAYIFAAASYIFLGTLIEMLGVRPVLADINACMALALFTYLQIAVYSLVNRGLIKGALHSLKEITVFASFSFRMFGSILSGMIIMELVYSIIYLSFVIPAFLSVIFTLFHAFIQSYVFAMLSSLFLGEAIGEAELEGAKIAAKTR